MFYPLKAYTTLRHLFSNITTTVISSLPHHHGNGPLIRPFTSVTTFTVIILVSETTRKEGVGRIFIETAVVRRILEASPAMNNKCS